MTYKRMYYLVNIEKRKESYKTQCQQNKYRHKQSYKEQKLKIKQEEASVGKNNEHNKPFNVMSKVQIKIVDLFVFFVFYDKYTRIKNNGANIKQY